MVINLVSFGKVGNSKRVELCFNLLFTTWAVQVWCGIRLFKVLDESITPQFGWLFLWRKHSLHQPRGPAFITKIEVEKLILISYFAKITCFSFWNLLKVSRLDTFMSSDNVLNILHLCFLVFLIHNTNIANIQSAFYIITFLIFLKCFM